MVKCKSDVQFFLRDICYIVIELLRVDLYALSNVQKFTKLSKIKFSLCCKGENIDHNYNYQKKNPKLSKEAHEIGMYHFFTFRA